MKESFIRRTYRRIMGLFFSRYYFSDEESSRIVAAIENAEKNCSGEIRVHVAKYCSSNILDDAANVFARLEMHKTELRNGVLFYIATSERKFAVLGDVGINALVPEGFWNDVCDVLSQDFKKGNVADGLVKGIELCGDKLNEFFPCQKDDVNELPNEITYSRKR